MNSSVIEVNLYSGKTLYLDVRQVSCAYSYFRDGTTGTIFNVNGVEFFTHEKVETFLERIGWR